MGDRQLDCARDGPQWLEDPNIAASFVEALLYGERVRRSYDLFAWVVMPNHVHVVLKPHAKLRDYAMGKNGHSRSRQQHRGPDRAALLAA